MKKELPKRKPNFTERLRALKPGSDECLVAKTAMEFRSMLGCFGNLRNEHMQFRTANGSNGHINVWRLK